MTSAVLILSEDAVFARMLELELQMHGISARVCTDLTNGAVAAVILADLDTSVIPDGGAGARIIGFTRSHTVASSDPDRRCSMILHRPFEVNRLVAEVDGLLHHTGARSAGAYALSLAEGRLSYGDASVALGPREQLLMERLLLHPRTVLTFEEIGELIGGSVANKSQVYICLLRKKLSLVTKTVTIRTLRGIGYQLEEI